MEIGCSENVSGTMIEVSKFNVTRVRSVMLTLVSPGFFLICLIRVYQRVFSPLKNLVFGVQGCCRFSPSCSCYAVDALRHHGAMRGSWLAVKRILRCNPWGGEGYDPVPGQPR